MRIPRRLRGFAALLGLVLVLATLQAVTAAKPAAALTGADWSAGNIISDQVFYDSGVMSAQQIQSFISGQESGCTASNGMPCLKDYTQSTSSVAASAGRCTAYAGAASESASQIIFKVAQACGINPQVLIVLLQKEQGLISSTAPTSGAYRSATGYGCPDTAACDSQYYGFFNQVYKAAWQFKQYAYTPASFNFRVGTFAIAYSPTASCGSSAVNIQNQATASLYNYTPYQPNAAALSNLGGIGDGCSSYGNRNFWVFFNNWFGSATGPVDPLAYVDSTAVTYTASAASIQVSGWVADRTNLPATVEMDIYVDQPNGVTAGYGIQSNNPRPDVAAAYPGAGPNHGFSATLKTPVPGSYRLCFYPHPAAGAWLLSCTYVTVPAPTPLASLDALQLTQSGGKAQIVGSGWAFDRSLPAGTAEIDVYSTGPNGVTKGTSFQATGSRPDVGAAYPGAGNNHGFSFSVPVTQAGSYGVCVYALAPSPWGPAAFGLGCKDFTAGPSHPTGSLDGAAAAVNSSGLSINVSGWAFDTTLPTQSIPVDIYIDKPSGGTIGTEVTASTTRNDIASAFPGAGAAHGFSAQIPVNAPGTYRVCAFAIGTSVFGSGSALLDCRSVVAAAKPVMGSLDAVSASASQISVSGWSYDPSLVSQPNEVDVYVDQPGGTTVGYALQANASRPDVGTAFPGVGPNHGFSSQLPASRPGNYRACAYALGNNPLGQTTALGCRTVSVK
jgi:hypothetical protein